MSEGSTTMLGAWRGDVGASAHVDRSAACVLPHAPVHPLFRELPT